jgi:hypothetical protein
MHTWLWNVTHDPRPSRDTCADAGEEWELGVNVTLKWRLRGDQQGVVRGLPHEASPRWCVNEMAIPATVPPPTTKPERPSVCMGMGADILKRSKRRSKFAQLFSSSRDMSCLAADTETRGDVVIYRAVVFALTVGRPPAWCGAERHRRIFDTANRPPPRSRAAHFPTPATSLTH